jgi:fermentation-respiration switch protein FrsA (DUF1100 family)
MAIAMRSVMGTVFGLLVIVVGALALIWTLQRGLMYFPAGEVLGPDQVGLPGVATVTFATTDGLELNGWFVAADPGPAWFTVIVFNGNAGNRSYRAPLARALAREGMAVLLFDYRGYGENPGVPTEPGLALDSRAAREYVRSRADVDPTRVAYLGESLGSALATGLAAEHPPAALILRSPFSSMADVGQFHYPFVPVRWLLRDRFAAIDRIAQIRCPLLVIAGDRDRIVPLAHSRRLYEAAARPKTLRIIPGADHNDGDLLAGREMIEVITYFLKGLT